MANPDIGKTVLTYAGRALLAACQTGKTLHFSKFSLSDGEVDDNEDLLARTSLINDSKFDAPIVEAKVTGTGTVQIRAQISNKNLLNGFFAREMGLFAVHPDTGVEILYAYLNNGDRSDYIPAGGAENSYILEQTLESVIDRAQNITATIDGSAVFVTYAAFNDHANSTNPHPNIPVKMPNVENPSGFWGIDNDANLHVISINDARTAINGTQSSSIPLIVSRLSQIEMEVSNILLERVAAEEAPDSNLIITEDFSDPDKIDQFKVRVISIVAGSNSIDLESLNGIINGAQYWISDTRSQEYVKVESVTKNGATNRVILTSPLHKTYSDTETYMYRTTAEIQNSKALGSGEQRGFSITPDLTWAGVKGSTEQILSLDTSLKNSNSFEIEGDISFNSNAFITLTA